MKAISIRQPFVEQILTGSKVREYRSRVCNVRGRVLLHASKTIDDEWYDQAVREGWYGGCLVGSVEVVGCEPDPDNGFAWLLAYAVRFAEPLAYRGKVGWFEVPDAIVLSLR